MQPCRGITWWAHRDDDRARDFQLALTPNFIGSKDPHALKIPVRKGGKHSLAENAPSPVQAEPRHTSFRMCGMVTLTLLIQASWMQRELSRCPVMIKKKEQTRKRQIR